MQKPMSQIPSQVGMTQPTSFTPYGYGASKKIDVPNGRVGVIIGKSGETIRNLQLQSGAKIQVTRDMDADPNSQTRPVELTGTSEQVSRAEQLINDLLAEADAGASGSVSNRRFGGDVAGAEHFSMKVPNNKVGLIIGKGGETIKTMQANSGARIQVIPLHLPPGDTSNERTVHMEGTNEQIEAAKKLVNEIVNSENRRNPQAGGYPQQSYRPPQPPTSWGPPPPLQQQPGYGYMQPGAYPGAPPQYTQPPYGGYPPQPAASTGYSSGWDQSSTQQTQQTTPATGYDYYQQQQQQQQPPTSAPADNTSAYNYSQPHPGYSSQGSYTAQQPTYGQENYAAPGYNTQTPQTGYDQSYNSAPAYAGATSTNPTQDGSAASNQPPSSVPASYPPQPVYGAPAPLTQPGYGQSPQSQKPPATPPAYAQTGYGTNTGYGTQYQQVQPYGGGPPAGQPPAYGSEGGAAPAAPGAVTKASPQS
ncbi:far upstream element-binding protein 2-like [Asparagus officinalis]|uniref:far upstream element-binding protein 2-like n=1 Tax=Asparagus officinalis TaxID=4686 RepID=UPI00098E47E2|nr:far upstream element-binding protein 2-like [Asparagus officinalis]